MDIRAFYEDCMYGQWRCNEKVSYLLGQENELKIFVEANGKKVSFNTKLFLPEPETAKWFGGKNPFIVCMHPIRPKDYALSEGYAVIELDTLEVARDDCRHEGKFYELYPYGSDPKSQTGVLMAWAWNASKILDAVEAGLGDEVGLDINAAMVTGVSRWGKATAVSGAFEKRFACVIPSCSGAGGLALNNVVSEGNTYDFSAIGGPKDYTYTKNEPLDCLQSEAERGWFNDYYLNYKTYADIPVEQYELINLAAAKDRFYYIIASAMGEDWVNAPAMWECYLRANETYEEQGIGDNLIIHVHKEGHAVLEEDLKLLFPYFEKNHYGFDRAVDMDKLKTSIFAKQ